MAGPQPTRSICRPWAQVSQLPEQRPKLDTDAWERLLWQASELLYALSARQYSGGCESRVALTTRPDGHAGWTWPWDTVVADVPGGALSGTLLGRLTGGAGWSVVALPDPPVTEVVAVSLNGQPIRVTTDPTTGHMWRADHRSWRHGDDLQVTYRHGLAPPIGGVEAALVLAVELGKAKVSDASCRLPKRVQTITREGVTVGFQDNTLAGLDAGRTGIWEVDVWLRAENPHAMARRPRVIVPGRGRMRRTL